jgi:hypothetical protein
MQLSGDVYTFAPELALGTRHGALHVDRLPPELYSPRYAQQALVLDIGSWMTRVGFAGDPLPRSTGNSMLDLNRFSTGPFDSGESEVKEVS